uniref:F-box and regulator of chromosome condensation repeat protein n=1 Tax=Pithovirus LCPAC202 TaxID=2506592 RepID=A0A481Z6V0_9VIRU|nr:MAG: F-box and regulator of chromosome condensation repeat protein [Pithovirus LCPAC202]
MDDPIKACLSILPHEKLIEILLALDSLEDIFKACSSSTIFARVCQDDHFWKLRYRQDFGSGRPSEEMLKRKIPWREFYRLMTENISFPFSVGYRHLGIIDSNGQLSMLGRNMYGQLGNGTKISTNIPQIVLSNVRQISCGFGTTGAITKDGEVYSWGNNRQGKLGIGSHHDGDVLVPRLIKWSKKARKIVYSTSSSIALTEDGEVYVWGRLTNNLYTEVPLKLNLPSKEKCIDVSSGRQSFAAVTQSGKLYMWGDNVNYLYLSKNWAKWLIDASIIYNSDDPEHTKFIRPTLIPFSEHAQQISMGRSYLGVVTMKRELWMMGRNSLHQIGKYISSREEVNIYRKLLIKVNTLFDDTVILRLVLIKFPSQSNSVPSQVLYFNSRWRTSSVKLKDGRIFMWGDNNDKQIGPVKDYERSIGLFGVLGGREIPKPTEIRLDHPIVYIMAGGEFTVAITDDDYINLWGKKLFSREN